MANPPVRARPRRAVNATPEAPIVPEYERMAREYIVSNKVKNQATKDEKTAFNKCWKSMAAHKIGSFEILDGNTTYKASIDGGSTDKVSVEKLFEQEKDGTITRQQLMECMSASQAAVKKTCGSNVLATVSKTTAKEATLTIKEVKA